MRLYKIVLLLVFCYPMLLQGQKNKDILTPQTFNKIKLTDNFWLPRLTIEQNTLIPFAFEKTEPAVENLRRTANFLKGVKDKLPSAHRFRASDLYKVMEGASYLLMLKGDTALENKMDDIITIIGEAQKPDGYLYEAHIAGVAIKEEMGERPYSWEVHSHELYNMGHMYEGAVAYYMATGKDKWLKIAEKSAQHINKVFFYGDPNYNNGKPVMQAPGHEELELALVKLYHATGKELYLQMANKFLEIRGVTYRPNGEGIMAPQYAQQHLPVKDQRTAVGHAVRATYLYSAMADVAALDNDTSYVTALTSIWHNIVDTKMHITGGLGAVHGIEGFGEEYQLPNKEAYDETCAAVGNVLFNHRMFLLSQDAKYMDVAEVALFNNVLAGVNLQGNKFFYVNPLEADGKTPFNAGISGRSPWFETACCPTNIARLLPQVSGMIYSYKNNTIYCTLYASNNTTVPLANGFVSVSQVSNYPFDEITSFTVNPQNDNQQFDVKLRIPTWVGSQFVPGDLYHYVNSSLQSWAVMVNGKKYTAQLKKGFATISRKWRKGDIITLYLPMAVRFTTTIDNVNANKGRIAISRGPLVYCAEDIDNQGKVLNYFIEKVPVDKKISLNKIDTGLLQGIYKVSIPADEITNIKPVKSDLQLVPYYVWNNRGVGAMEVWFPTDDKMTTGNDDKANYLVESIHSSNSSADSDLIVLIDNNLPKNSGDVLARKWVSNNSGKPNWLDIRLKKQTNIKSVAIYWAVNKKTKLPQSWKLSYDDKAQWKDFPLYVTDSYSISKDQFNVVRPAKDIYTDHLKVLIQPKDKNAIGVFEIQIEEIKQ